MARFQFSRSAEADLLAIADYTLRTWGEDQALSYVAALETCCQMLADNPALGRACGYIRPGLHRMEKGRHVVLYRQVTGGIVISRILHQRMLPEEQNSGDEED